MAGNLIKPSLEFILIFKLIDVIVNFIEDILKNVFCIMFVLNSFKNKSFEKAAEFLPNLVGFGIQ